IAEIRVVNVVPAQHLCRDYRPGDVAGQRAAGTVGIDRLYLILCLARSVIIAGAGAQYRFAIEFLRRPRNSEPWPEVRFLRVIPRRRTRQVASGRGTAGELTRVRVE